MDKALKQAHRNRYKKILPLLSEKNQRIVLGSDAELLGYGGVSLVSELSGVSRPTIQMGKMELHGEIEVADISRVRRQGGGRKKETEKQSGLEKQLESMMEPVTRGHPESVLRWSCISTRKLSEALTEKGYSVSHKLVGRLLTDLGYSLQGNMKSFESSATHPDRNAQFYYINKQAKKYIEHEQPVISVDTKKKELMGNYKNPGQEYRQKGSPRKVNAHDFGKNRASPYGIYDVAENEGFVNVGMSYDTSQFAVDSIKQWWNLIGKKKYREASKLLITADGGGSNGYRVRQWKTCLQHLADKTRLQVTVCHFPPGTSKWNKIEHRLFSYISLNWKGVPLVDIETMIQLIGAVTTKEGLKVTARKEVKEYEIGVKISDEELKQVNLFTHKFHGEWNYTIKPNL